LIDRCIAQALLRRRLDDRPITHELRGFADAYRRAKAVLAVPLAAATGSPAGSTPCAVEAYLSGAIC
jgi:hypothetical protein